MFLYWDLVSQYSSPPYSAEENIEQQTKKQRFEQRNKGTCAPTKATNHPKVVSFCC